MIWFLLQQAVEDVNQGVIKSQKHLYELKSLQDFEKRNEYLNLVRSLDDYTSVTFPHCACKFRFQFFLQSNLITI